MSEHHEKAQAYSVKMIGATGLSAAQRSAAELRFRMALEFGVCGPQYVVPTLQACILARSLLDNLLPEEVAEAEHGAEHEVIALWENAEGKAIVAAFKPFNRDMGEARFEISV